MRSQKSPIRPQQCLVRFQTSALSTPKTSVLGHQREGSLHFDHLGHAALFMQ